MDDLRCLASDESTKPSEVTDTSDLVCGACTVTSRSKGRIYNRIAGGVRERMKDARGEGGHKLMLADGCVQKCGVADVF